jgi:hypothetical protein
VAVVGAVWGVGESGPTGTVRAPGRPGTNSAGVPGAPGDSCPGIAALGTPGAGGAALGLGAEVITSGGEYPPGSGPYGPCLSAAHGRGLPGVGIPSAAGV